MNAYQPNAEDAGFILFDVLHAQDTLAQLPAMADNADPDLMRQVLEEAGYTVDFAGGSSIGGFVATHLALGYDAQKTYDRFRRAFNEERLGKLFGGNRNINVVF